jgi:hypothetical protein
VTGYALTHFTTRYYLHPSPAAAIEAMRLANDRASTSHDPTVMALMFARAAQRDSLLRDAYAYLASAAGAQSFAALVCSLVDAGEPGDPLAAELASPIDLERHWSEFVLTGDPRLIVRIIDVLEWPDLVRKILVAWLRKPKKFFARSPATMAQQIAKTTGIRIDVAARKILSTEDLDCMVVVDGHSRRDPDALAASVAALPLAFQLDDESATKVAIKGSALCSLSHNASLHAVVNDICAREAARRSGATRRALEKITTDTSWQRAWSAPLPPLDGILGHPLDHPIVLDVLWAQYFVTGDTATVRRIISGLKHLDATFQAATFSLQSVICDHPSLFSLCEQIFDEDPQLTANERIGLAVVFSKLAPDRWRLVPDPVTGRPRILRAPR